MALALFVLTGSAQEQPSNAQTLVVDTISQPETLDPAWSFFTADSAVLSQIYETLVDYNEGSVSSYVSEIAEEVPTVANGLASADFKSYTFNIRSGILFWDGSELTCEDVEYSFERFLAMDRDGGGSFLMSIPALGTGGSRSDGNLKDTIVVDGVTKSYAQAIDEAYECDGNALIVTLADPLPQPAMMSLMAHSSSGSIYSKAYAIANGAADNANRTQFLVDENNPQPVSSTALFNGAMGTGAFRLLVWDLTSEQVILGRNDAFRDGPASFQNVIYSNVPEFTTRLLRLQNGDADISYLSERTQTAQLIEAAPSGVRVIEGLTGFTTETVHMNQDVHQVDAGNQFVGSGLCDGAGITADFFSNVNTRRAFAHSFDQQNFVDSFLLGAGTEVATPIPPAVEFFDSEVAPIPFDLAAAEAEFKLASCDGGATSLWDTGFSFTAVYNDGNSRRQTAMEQVEFNVESLNSQRQGMPPFDITVIGQPGPTVLGAVFGTQTLPMFVFGWSPDFIDIDNWIRQWMDADAGTWAAFTGLSMVPESAQWTADLNTAFQSTDASVRQEIYSALQQDYVDFALAITMPARTLDNVERTWVNGNYYNPGKGDPQEPPNVYILSKIAGGKANETALSEYGGVVTEF
jgi:peptide/nickel transport system substrate-binding protein